MEGFRKAVARFANDGRGKRSIAIRGSYEAIIRQLENELRESVGGSASPTAGVAVDQSYMLHGHRVRVTTLDLNRPWLEIASTLLSLLDVQPGQAVHPPM